MAGPAERGIEPWEGTGWPVRLIVDEKIRKDISYLCSRKECRNLLRDPCQLACGHRYCAECIKIIEAKHGIDRVCIPCALELQYDDAVAATDFWPEPYQVDESLKRYPHCTIDVSKVSKDTSKDREINRVVVKCPWECLDKENRVTRLKIKDLLTHLRGCTFRKLRCEQCGEEIEAKSMKSHKERSCANRIVDCPHGCKTRNLLAKDLQAHKHTCTAQPEVCRICSSDISSSIFEHMKVCQAACPYGCTDGEVVNIASHFHDKKFLARHQLGMARELVELKAESQADGESHQPSSSSLAPILDKLMVVEQKEEKSRNDMVELVGRLEQQPPNQTRRAIDQLLRSADTLQTSINMIKELTDTVSALTSDVHTFSLYNDLFHETLKKVAAQDDSIKARLRTLETKGELRDAAIAENRLRIQEIERSGYDGTFVWKVTNIEKLKQKAKDGSRYSIFSEPFYTSTYGYKMCLRLYLNGDGGGKNTHISLFFVVMKGRFDETLSWPFANKVTMMLLCQTDPKNHKIEKFKPDRTSSSFIKPKDDKNIASGCPQFELQDRAFNESNGFVVNDTMFFKCEVEKLPNTDYQD